MISTDIKYALRLLAKTPALTLLTIVVLAGGLGISIYTFSMLNTLVYKDLPFEDGESIVRIFSERQGRSTSIDAYDFNIIQEEARSLTEIGAFQSTNAILSNNQISRHNSGVYASWNIFNLTRVQPQLGRWLRPDDSRADAEPVIILSHEMWQTLFAADPAALNRLISVNAVSTRIVGIMPPEYKFPVFAHFWLPLSSDTLSVTQRREAYVQGFARLKDGYGKNQADSELTTIIQRVNSLDVGAEPDDLHNRGYTLKFPLAQVQDGGPFIFAVLNVVATFILLLACINVGNLLLSRTNERIKEIAVRMALGAKRRRLVPQMMWESIIICLLGGILALLMAGWALDITNVFLSSHFGQAFPFWWQWELDHQSVIAAVLFVILAVFFTGLVPAWKTTNTDLNQILRDGTRGARGRKIGKTSRVLVVVQIVFISVIMFLGSIMTSIAYKAVNVDLGKETDNVLAAPMTLPVSSYGDQDSQLLFYNRLQSSLEQNPVISGALVQGIRGNQPISIEGISYNLESDYPEAYVNSLLGSLDHLGVDLVEGRSLGPLDTKDNLKVAMISESLAKREWPTQSSLGKRFKLNNGNAELITVVGIVRDVVEGNPISKDKSNASIYLPLTQFVRSGATVIIKYSGNESEARSALFSAIAALDPTVAPDQVIPLDSLLLQVAQLAASATNILIICGVFALLLAIMGIYGLSSNSITQRTQEVGLRRALGARDSDIIKQFMFGGSKQAIIGLSIGLIVSSLVSYMFAKFLVLSNVTYIVAAFSVLVIISTAVLMAIFLATRRAVKHEPSDALRYE